jgi:hypothetical protein
MPIAGRAIISTNINTAELREIRRTFKAIKPDSPEWSRELGQAYKQAGMLIVARAQARALGMSPETAGAARAIKASTVGAAGGAGLRINVSAGGRVPYALVGIFGAKKRTGWYAAKRYSGSPRQHLPWVGANWQVGGDDGPYALNPAIGESMDEAMRMLAEALEALMGRFNGLG